jgi:hypothetical protein
MKIHTDIISSFFCFLYLPFIANGQAFKIHTEIASNTNKEGKIASSATNFKTKALVPNIQDMYIIMPTLATKRNVK